jgi:hypothetical protein
MAVVAFEAVQCMSFANGSLPEEEGDGEDGDEEDAEEDAARQSRGEEEEEDEHPAGWKLFPLAAFLDLGRVRRRLRDQGVFFVFFCFNFSDQNFTFLKYRGFFSWSWRGGVR